MKTEEELAPVRARFVALSAGYWQAIREGDGRRATADTDRAQRIVDELADDDGVERLLGPLLTDPSREVRYAAAALLLRRGIRVEDAVAELEALARDPTGLVSVTAKMLLLQAAPGAAEGDGRRRTGLS